MELALEKIIEGERSGLAAAVEIVKFLAGEGVHVWWCDDRKLASEEGFEAEGDYEECSREAFPCGVKCGCRWAIDLQDHASPKHEDRSQLIKQTGEHVWVAELEE